MRPRHLMIATTAVLTLTAAACGDDSSSPSAGSATRTIKVEMVDIGYKPTSLQVKTGETIRFEFTNNGKVEHDAVIGDDMQQAAHEEEMSADTSGMDHGSHGADSEAISVEPGETGKLEHTFDKAGDLQIGCHEPGHYAAGMKIDITVA